MQNRKQKVRARPPMVGVRPATVVGLTADPAVLEVRAAGVGPHTDRFSARLALATPYLPSVGDRVIVGGDESDAYVIGVVLAARSPGFGATTLADGTRIDVTETAVDIRDREGQLLVRVADGHVEIAAKCGDVTVSADRDIVLSAGRNIAVRAGDAEAQSSLVVEPQTIRAETATVAVKTTVAKLVAAETAVLSRKIHTTAEALTQEVERFELTATRIVERAKDTFRDTAELLQERAGRARFLVRDLFSLDSRRTAMQSEDETSIDGKKVLLG